MQILHVKRITLSQASYITNIQDSGRHAAVEWRVQRFEDVKG